jgi:hypothetical protein
MAITVALNVVPGHRIPDRSTWQAAGHDAFLKAGAGVDLAKGPPVEHDPVAAWSASTPSGAPGSSRGCCRWTRRCGRAGNYGPRTEVAEDADPQIRLLAFIGRTP